MVACAEAAAHIGAARIDTRRFVRGVGLAKQEGDGLGGVVGRLHADDEFEDPAARVIPSKTAFRFEKHRFGRLRLELALEHQPRRIVSRKLGANVFAVTRGLRVLLPDGNRQPRPDRPLGVLKFSRTDPAILDRRIDVGSIRRGPGDSGKTKRGVGRPRDRTGLLAVSHHVAIAQREPRLIEAVKILEDQDRDRLAEIERRSADGAEEVACVKFGNARSDARQILGSNDHGRFQGAGQTRQIERVTDVRGVGGADEHGVRGLRRPTRQRGNPPRKFPAIRSRVVRQRPNATR